jgi:UDP-N-acetylmuramate--alanine ligase
LAIVAKQAGYEVSGSDLHDSHYIDNLRRQGISITIGQTVEQFAEIHSKQPIDWFVYSSALPKTNPNHPELLFCQQNNIKTSKRDELLNEIIEQKKLKLIAIAGTHGKTTTTAMTIWLLKQLGIPISYSAGAKMSFGDMGHFEPGSHYFIYEADEYDRNFLNFKPHLSMITGIDWDHPDIYPTQEAYNQAFRQFLDQSQSNMLWQNDAKKLAIDARPDTTLLDQTDETIEQFSLPGLVNRQNAWLVLNSIAKLVEHPRQELMQHLDAFPGLSRRFEEIVPGVYSDYAHTPPKIAGALQMAQEVAGDKVVVVYEGLHNTRQHFIKKELEHLFDGVKQLYIVPSYLAREDKSLKLLSPADLKGLLSHDAQVYTQPAELNEELANSIRSHINRGDLVLCLSAGGAGSLDEWLRRTL